MHILLLYLAIVYTTAVNAYEPMPANRADEEPACVTLTVFVLDENVQPPFAHADHFLRLISENPNHNLRNRDGATFTIQTSEPNHIFSIASDINGPSIKAIYRKGKSVPIYGLPLAPRKILEDEDERLDFYAVLATFPEGIYAMEDIVTSEPISMFVSVEQNTPSLADPIRSLALDVEIWAGEHLLKPSETRYKEKMIESFSNQAGASDGSLVELTKSGFVLNRSLPYGMGDSEIIVIVNELGTIDEVLTVGRKFKVKSFRPLFKR